MTPGEFGTVDPDRLRSLAPGIQWDGTRWTGGGVVLYRLAVVSRHFQAGSVVDVVDNSGVLLATLVHCCGVLVDRVEDLSDVEYLCLIDDAEDASVVVTAGHTFRRSYLAVEASRQSEYETDFMDSSTVWGGLLHDGVHQFVDPVIQPVSQLVATKGIQFPTDHHKVPVTYAALEPYAFERFLKLYHMLELLFEWDTVVKLRALGDDLRGVGRLMSEYTQSELPALKRVLKYRCLDMDSLIPPLAKLRNHESVAKQIFLDHKKSGAPSNLGDDLLNELFFSHEFSRTRMNAWAKHGLSTMEAQDKLILDCTAYFIYRIRCSIAHNRIGEFMFDRSDEAFVAGFGEPLLRAVLRSAMRA